LGRDQVITDASLITTAWLEAVLRRDGALRSGGVRSVEIDSRTETWSNSARLRVHYQPGSSGDLPEVLFVKMCGGGVFGPSEVDYYCRDYMGVVDLPIVRCYDARYDAHRRAYHLLLADLSATHTNAWEVAITPELVASIADAAAALHAHRWSEHALAEIGEGHPGALEIERYFAHVGAGLEPLLAIGVDDVKAEWRPVLREIFARLPEAMSTRTRQHRGICLVHGDINPGNQLVPRAGSGPLYLIDRQPFDWSLRVWLGVSDLAYLMCSFWPTETRRALEQEMMRHYHAALVRRGIDDYGWDELWRDYRLSAVQAACVAVEWCVLEADRERMRWLWKVELQRAMDVFEDLRCWELWSGTAQT
jgi:hypothetical protein